MGKECEYCLPNKYGKCKRKGRFYIEIYEHSPPSLTCIEHDGYEILEDISNCPWCGRNLLDLKFNSWKVCFMRELKFNYQNLKELALKLFGAHYGYFKSSEQSYHRSIWFSFRDKTKSIMIEYSENGLEYRVGDYSVEVFEKGTMFGFGKISERPTIISDILVFKDMLENQKSQFTTTSPR